ncbi:MAG: hypothetical protein Q9168_004341 [Polycauliona sp. 1 TL-2023]
MADTHGLTEADVDAGLEGGEPPAVRMASSPNPNLLEALLSHGWSLSPYYHPDSPSLARRYGPNAYMTGRVDGVYDSPLLRAIETGQLANMNILLRAGADPNGQIIYSMYEYGEQFVRLSYRKSEIEYRNSRSNLQSNAQLDRNAPAYTEQITRAEIEEGPARFWAGKDFPPRFLGAFNGAMTAVEMAARKGSIEALEAILTAGADTSFWLSSPPSPPLAFSLSSLSVSSPLHAAIEERKTKMLQELLLRGFNPNLLPLQATTSCLSPLMTALACDPPNIEACEILLSQADIDTDLRSPVYQIHALHIAAAQLSASLFQFLCEGNRMSLDRAGKTALGHTLLHIACLPLDPSEINQSSSLITMSIHRMRTLSRQPFSRSSRPSTASQSPQLDTVKYILSGSHCSTSEQDEFGNTPLHYLASYIHPNEPLIALLRSSEIDTRRVWSTSRNQWGYTPEELYSDEKHNTRLEKDRRLEIEQRSRRGGWRGRGRGRGTA